jgi:hypothetical protein
LRREVQAQNAGEIAGRVFNNEERGRRGKR